MLVVESSLVCKFLEGINVLKGAEEGDEEDRREYRSLAQERVVQVDETGTASGVDEVRERVANHSRTAVRLLRFGKVETAHPDRPRDNGRVEETIFIVHGRHVFQHLTVDDFRINHGIPVGLASRVLELFEVPVTVNPAGILPLRLFAAEDGASHGGGAGSLAESLFAFEGTTSLERGRAAFRRSGSNDRSVIEKRFTVSTKVPRVEIRRSRRRRLSTQGLHALKSIVPKLTARGDAFIAPRMRACNHKHSL